MKHLLVVAMVAMLVGCSATPSSDDDSSNEDISNYQGRELGGETHKAYDERRDSYDGERGEFAGAGCTVDCGGHEAGAEWAAEQGIDDPDDCGGNSWSFEEGCRAYAEGHSSEVSSDDYEEVE